jgi:hypothetical protein
VPLATALCNNLPAENAQRQLISPKPKLRVVVPIEEKEEEDEELRESEMALHENS